jgi:hypothetical protein
LLLHASRKDHVIEAAYERGVVLVFKGIFPISTLSADRQGVWLKTEHVLSSHAVILHHSPRVAATLGGKRVISGRRRWCWGLVR